MHVLRTKLLAASGMLAFGMTGLSAASAEPVNVIATFSILGDMVSKVGSEHVDVSTLVGPNGDGHVYAPTPADARATAAADLVVVNGLGFEGWIDRLVDASGYAGPVAVASKGAATLKIGEAHEHDEEATGAAQDTAKEDHPAHADAHAEAGEAHADDHAHEVGEDHAESHSEAGHAQEAASHKGEEEAGHHHEAGDADPHAWQSIENAVVYVENIADALCGADAENCDSYRANASTYAEELTTLDRSIKAQFAAIPQERRKVITSHDAFGYFGEAYDVEFLSPQGVSTESEASAADVASLINQIRDEKVTALFVENVSDPRLIEQIGRETGVRPGGELYSDALSEPGGPASTYVEMMRHNADVLLSAMQAS